MYTGYLSPLFQFIIAGGVRESSIEPVRLPRIFCQLVMDDLSINVMLLLTVFQFFLRIKCPIFLL